MITLLLSLAVAFAQEPTSMWTQGSTDLLRWPDAQAVTVTLDPAEKVEVVLEDGDMLRVRHGTDFGWVPRTALTAEDPSAAATQDVPKLELAGPPSLK